MRQRKIKNLDEKLEGLSHLTVEDADQNKGKWKAFLSGTDPSVKAGADTSDKAGAELSGKGSAKLYAEFG